MCRIDIQLGHAAWIRSIDKQHEDTAWHAAWISSIDKQHEHEVLT
jgi:hypothetical protein